MASLFLERRTPVRLFPSSPHPLNKINTKDTKSTFGLHEEKQGQGPEAFFVPGSLFFVQ